MEPKFKVGDVVFNHEADWGHYINKGDTGVIMNMNHIDAPIAGQTPGYLLMVKLIKNGRDVEIHEQYCSLKLAKDIFYTTHSNKSKKADEGWGF